MYSNIYSSLPHLSLPPSPPSLTLLPFFPPSPPSLSSIPSLPPFSPFLHPPSHPPFFPPLTASLPLSLSFQRYVLSRLMSVTQEYSLDRKNLSHIEMLENSIN